MKQLKQIKFLYEKVVSIAKNKSLKYLSENDLKIYMSFYKNVVNPAMKKF